MKTNGREMKTKTLGLLVLGLLACALSAPARANVIAEFNLDASDPNNFFLLSLGAGSYELSLRAGVLSAWSAWPTTSTNCADDCPQGWLNFFGVFNASTGQGGYVENGIFTSFADYDFNQRLAYATPELALAAGVPFLFTVDVATDYYVFIPDCDGCFGDNRGGLSFGLRSVPEPGTLALLGLGLAGFSLTRRRTA